MKLDQVQIQDFRNIKAVTLTPCPSLNVVLGQNGSGKSSLLEALHYLGYARSFRTTKHKNVIQQGCGAFSIFCRGSSDNSEFKLGLSRDINDGVKVNVNGRHSSKSSDLASKVPLQIFTPQSSDLISGSPGLRRRFLDWGLFHVEQQFYQVANVYRNVLKQKNALLRSASFSRGKSSENLTAQEQYWDQELIKYGDAITQSRESILEALQPYISANLTQFLPEFSVKISYHRGWEKDSELSQALAKKAMRDRERGFVSVGPHKADIKFRVDGVDAAEVLSRGQLRMLVAALQLSQVQYLNQQSHKSCIFLLDDVGAELDAKKRELFVDALIMQNSQIFVTAIEADQIGFIEKYKNRKMFHVEHGQVREEN